MFTFNTYITTLFLLILGLIFGSFISMASYRLPKNSSLKGYSKCPKCKHKLHCKDLIPLVSFILTKGKCRYCNKSISFRYPLTEIATALLFILNGFIFEYQYALIAIVCLVTAALLIITISDFETYIVPDETIIALGILGVLYAYLQGYEWIQVLLMPSVTFLIGLFLQKSSKIILDKEALGMGDVKFFLVSGLYLPADTLSSFFLMSGAIGIIFAIWWRILGRGQYFPFAPSLCISLYICILFPKYIGFF